MITDNYRDIFYSITFAIWTDFSGFCEDKWHFTHETNVMLSSFLHANSHPDSHFPFAKFQSRTPSSVLRDLAQERICILCFQSDILKLQLAGLIFLTRNFMLSPNLAKRRLPLSWKFHSLSSHVPKLRINTSLMPQKSQTVVGLTWFLLGVGKHFCNGCRAYAPPHFGQLSGNWKNKLPWLSKPKMWHHHLDYGGRSSLMDWLTDIFAFVLPNHWNKTALNWLQRKLLNISGNWVRCQSRVTIQVWSLIWTKLALARPKMAD
jgi:hypothetical protein